MHMVQDKFLHYDSLLMIQACMSQLQTSILAFDIKFLATKPGKMQLDDKKHRPRPHFPVPKTPSSPTPLTQPPPAST